MRYKLQTHAFIVFQLDDIHWAGKKTNLNKTTQNNKPTNLFMSSGVAIGFFQWGGTGGTNILSWQAPPPPSKKGLT